MFRPPFYDEHPVLIHPAAPRRLLRLFRWVLLAAVLVGLYRVIFHHSVQPERNPHGNPNRPAHQRSMDTPASNAH